jgi:hypothetical protein
MSTISATTTTTSPAATTQATNRGTNQATNKDNLSKQTKSNFISFRVSPKNYAIFEYAV